MGAREDLIKVAAGLAERAAAATLTGRPITYESVRIAGLAEGARAALEAAALVDADPAPITAALIRLDARLEDVGLASVLEAEGIEAALSELGDVVEAAQGSVIHGKAFAKGFFALKDLLQGLERDFSASDTPTAQRITARIHMGLEDAVETMEKVRRGEETPDGS